jgi:TonB-dependent starch-binding outer membrane protein SusC
MMWLRHTAHRRTLRKTAYDFDGTRAYGYAPNNIGNSELKWENSSLKSISDINMGFVQKPHYG